MIAELSLTGPLALPLLVVAMLLLAGALSVGVYSLFGQDRSAVEKRIGAYIDGGDFAADGDSGPAALAETEILQRAVGLTSRLADRAGILERTEKALEQSNINLRPAEALFFYAALVVIGGAILLMLSPNKGFAVILILVMLLLPPVFLARMRTKRLVEFAQTLPDALTLLSGSLRAGYSFGQGLEAVGAEASGPMADEFQRILAEGQLGRPLEEAMFDSAVRMESQDLEWAVMAIKIQREVGGNLAELLDTVAETMTQRDRLKGEMRSLTAEGRLSAYIMSVLPVGLGLVMWTMSPEYIGKLFQNQMGWTMVGGGAFMMAIGMFWLFKLVKMDG